ncbi:MAG: 1-deoxy-D-xylulose-5-phosphate synthase [Granulosicoccaceae bacterium]
MMNTETYPLLETIDCPDDLQALAEQDLPQLADEARRFLIDTVSRTGGHLAANLGTIELTLALHYVFHSPEDRFIWDVGHQSYLHKILTGRREAMQRLRQQGGPAGFPKRSESEHDAFGVGHSSTSISAALGMAIAAKQHNEQRHVTAIIGDGAMTAGMAFEALNHAGDLDADLLVILNDNDMSISPNVGGLSKYFARILAGKLYNSVREGSKKVLSTMPPVWEFARRAEEHMKGMVVPGTLFEELGFNYVGPIDGHDLPALLKTLRTLKTLKGPRMLHIVTQKGRGFAPAEQNPCSFHGVSKFDPATGENLASTSTGPTYTKVFSDWLCDMAASDSRLIGITPAMREGSGLVQFSEQFPQRYFDVGIAEQHAVTLAAGLACEGMKPVVAIYSTFLQRAYDQLIHDVALQDLPVLFAIDRAGIVGADGPTHAGTFDLSFLRCIPNMLLMAPADEQECRQLLNTGYLHDGPAAVRYPRGTGPGAMPGTSLEPLPIGKAELRREGERIALLAFGSLLSPALEAAEQLDTTVANMRFIKPLDEQLVLQLAQQHELLVTLEENVVAGGAGSAIAELLNRHGIDVPLLQLGLPDEFIDHGDTKSLLAACGLDSGGIIRAVLERVSEPDCAARAARVK